MRILSEYGKKYKCWSPEFWGHKEEDAVEIIDFDEEEAAKRFAENRYDGSDHFDEIDVMVRDTATNKLYSMNICVEFTASFYSRSYKLVEEC